MIFLATPMNFADKFESAMRKIIIQSEKATYRNWYIVTAKQATYFLNDNFRENESPHFCQTMSRFFGEIVPQVEMEILRRSLAFYRSRPSNWSFNVQAQRFADADLNENGTAKLPLDRAVVDCFVKPRFRVGRFGKKNVNNKYVEMMPIPMKYKSTVSRVVPVYGRRKNLIFEKYTGRFS